MDKVNRRTTSHSQRESAVSFRRLASMADSQIHNDPDRLRTFAQRLTQFASTSEEHLTRVKSAVGHLGQTWQDQEFAKFAQQFSSAQGRLRSFIEETKKVT